MTFHETIKSTSGKLNPKRLFHIITAGRLLLFVALLAFFLLFPVPLKITNEQISLPLLLGSAFLLTTIYLLWHKKKGLQPGLIHTQTIFDVILACATVFLTGGVTSPLTFFFAIAILTASLLGGKTEGALSAIASTTIYSFLLGVSLNNSSNPENTLRAFFLNLAAFNLTAALGIYIAARLKKTEEELSRTAENLFLSQRLQEHLAESMNSGLLTLDKNGVIIFANRAAKKIIDFESGKVSGLHVSNIWKEHKDIIQKVILNKNKREEIQLKKDQNEVKHIGISGFPINDNEKNPIGYGIIFQDITENKIRDQKLRQMDRLAALGEMAAGLAHEIRNPLASISGAAEFLQETEMVTDDGRRLVNIIHRESKRLEELTKSFLLYGKPQKKCIKDISLNHEISRICNLLKQRKKFNKILYSIDIPDEHIIFMDPGLFTQVALNVILNAFQAVDKEEGVVTIFSEKGAESIFLKIKDNGKGIPEEQLDSIFNPFFTTRNDGTGLGLSIVYRIMNESGGMVSAESDETGTTITLAFPEEDMGNLSPC